MEYGLKYKYVVVRGLDIRGIQAFRISFMQEHPSNLAVDLANQAFVCIYISHSKYVCIHTKQSGMIPCNKIIKIGFLM